MSAAAMHPIRHYLQFSDLSTAEYDHLFERSALIKKKFKAYEKHQPLVDRTLAMIFEKASTRTRVRKAGAVAKGHMGNNAAHAECTIPSAALGHLAVTQRAPRPQRHTLRTR